MYFMTNLTRALRTALFPTLFWMGLILLAHYIIAQPTLG